MAGAIVMAIEMPCIDSLSKTEEKIEEDDVQSDGFEMGSLNSNALDAGTAYFVLAQQQVMNTQDDNYSAFDKK